MSDRDHDDDDWPEPIQTPEERKRADEAFEATFATRRRILRYAYLGLAVRVILVIVLAITH